MELFDFRHLRDAVEVYRQGSLTKAAASLYIAQPNLSRSVSELEKSLGFPLFLRTKKGMLPTPEGERFLKEAETLLSRLTRTAESIRLEKTRRLRFSSVPSSLYVNIILAAAKVFRGQFDIGCTERTDCRELFSDVVSEASEAAFLFLGTDMSKSLDDYCRSRGLEYHAVGESPAYMIVSQESRIFQPEKQPPGICFPETLLMVNIDYFDPIGIRAEDIFSLLPPVKGICHGTGRAGNLDMLANIDNLAMLSSHTYSRTLKQHHLAAVPLNPALSAYEYGYVTKKGRKPAPESERVLAAILEEFQKELAAY